MKYVGIYKCRMCDEIIKNPITGNKDLAFQCASFAAFDMPNLKKAQSPTIRNVHSCKDGSIGITDFLGFRNEVEQK